MKNVCKEKNVTYILCTLCLHITTRLGIKQVIKYMKKPITNMIAPIF